MKTITVFTPTFNRAYCLHQVYESLVKQTNQNFLWMIIDDGSSDNTKELVQSWIDEKKIEIHYIFQANLGMHGGHNTAYQNITTELNTCIDSDDFMPNDAIEKILNHWNTNKKEYKDVAGIIALDSYKDGKVIGQKIPENLKTCTLTELHQRYNVTGDKKLIYRTDIVKQFPLYPIFEGEKFVPLGSLYLLIDQNYKLLPLNEVVCIVEYLPDGSSKNIIKQYRKHPNGFLYGRKVRMKTAMSFKERFKNAIHLVSSAIFAKKLSAIFDNYWYINLLAIPLGIGLNFYIRYKTKN